jgi:conjugal transfer/type IV secretion protein DotA/TraY
MYYMANDFVDAIDPKNVNPLMSIQEFGIKLQQAGIDYFMATFFITFATVLGASIIPSITLSTAFKASAELPSSLTTLWVGMCFTLGGALGYYLIMILFIVWFSAIMSWIGQVFQAVFGGPLVALRMVDPEGEGILGKAGEGLTMIFSLCLSPFLLVVGFVVAMVLTKQGLILLNYMFSIFLGSAFKGQTSDIAWLMVGVPTIIIIYTTMAASLVQLVSTACITEGMHSVKGFFTASAVGQRMGSEMSQDTKGAASTQGSGAGQSAGGAATGAQKAADSELKREQIGDELNKAKAKPKAKWNS